MLWEKRAKRTTALEAARNLARTGEHEDWRSVEAALQARGGVQGAEGWFADHGFRAQLNQLCALAREGRTGPRGPRGARRP